MKNFTYKILAASALAMMVSAANAASLTSFDNRADFDAANTITSTDDFEDLGVAAGDVLSIGSPLTRGDFTFSAPSQGLVGLGSGIGGLTSVGLAPNIFADALTIDFASGFTAFGFDFSANNTSTLSIQVFDIADNLLEMFSVDTGSTLTFFGFTSDMEIGSVFLDDGSTGGPIVDNLAAGITTPVPLPATGLLLIGAIAGLGAASRRKKAAPTS